MNAINPTERDAVIAQVLDATTWDEIEAATHLLDRWLEAHLDDVGMEDGYEQLALLKSGLQSEAHTTELIGAR